MFLVPNVSIWVQVREAVDMLKVPKVQQEWVHASVLCKKLLPLRSPFDVLSDLIFNPLLFQSFFS